MTIQDIILDCQEDMGEVHGTAGHRDPFPWERLVRGAMDEVCRRSWCYYTTVAYDVTAGQAPVVSGGCSCPLFEIEEARLANSAVNGSGADATFGYLEIVTPRAFPDHWLLSPDWRNAPNPQPGPVCLVVAGANNLRLYGAPAFSSSAASGGGLLLTGYSTVNGTNADGTPLVALTDPLPLPERAAEAVKYGAKMRRAEQYPKEYGDRWAMLKSRYAETLGDLTAESRTQSAANARVGAWA